MPRPRKPLAEHVIRVLVSLTPSRRAYLESLGRPTLGRAILEVIDRAADATCHGAAQNATLLPAARLRPGRVKKSECP